VRTWARRSRAITVVLFLAGCARIPFMRLENDRVVDKGVVGKAEEKRIQQLRPNFVLREWQGTGSVPADRHDDGRP